MRKLATVAGATVAFMAAPAAFAGTFDASGQLHFDPNAVLVESFEGEMTMDGTTIKTGSAALEGSSYAVVNATSYVNIGAMPPAGGDSALVARLFVSGPGALASLAVVYADPGQIGPFYQYVNLYPTGVMTSDGWFEMISAPLPVQAAGNPSLQIIVQTQGTDDTLIDAVEIDVAAAPYVAPTACASIADCSGDLQCRAGICVGDGEVPPLPTATERAGLQELFTSDFRYHFGGELTRQNNLANAIAALDGMTTATTATGFWRHLTQAIEALRDSHSTIYAGDFGGASLTTCFGAGVGDGSTQVASDGTYPDVVTLYGDGAVLKPGDRLVAVDGKHPVQFVRDLSGYLRGNTYATDPLTYTGAIEHLNDAIADYATTLTVVRCDSTGKCGAQEDIAVSTLHTDLYEPLTCDHRPAYHLAKNNPDTKSHYLGDTIYSGLLADSNATEGLYGMIFDSLYQDFSQGDPYKPILNTFRTSAKGVVIDHRTGNGGYTFFATEVTGPFLKKQPIGADVQSEQLIWQPMPISQATGLSIYATNSKNQEDAFTVGSSAPTAGLKAAVLLSRDTSASDYLALGFANQTNVRTFGSQSDGAFSTIFDFSYAGSLSYSFGSWDTVLVDGTFRLGHGAQPDEPILPKQTDLAQGKDTVYLRALDWLRSCTDCGN